jgi:hypothetical protein
MESESTVDSTRHLVLAIPSEIEIEIPNERKKLIIFVGFNRFRTFTPSSPNRRTAGSGSVLRHIK